MSISGITVVLLLVAALSGCAGNDAPAATPSPSNGPADAIEPAPLFDSANCMQGMDMPGCTEEQAARVLPVLVDLSWDGTLGVGGYACVEPTGCNPVFAVPADQDHIQNVTEGRLWTVSLTMTWVAQTPATATLGLGIMTMDHCYGCNVTWIGTVEGTSPLTLDVTDLDMSVGEHNWFHSFGWNPTTEFFQDAGGVSFTPDQTFSIVGSASIQPANVTAPAASAR